MRHWPSRGQEKREGGAIPALSVTVADWGGAVPGACCALLPAASSAEEADCELDRRSFIVRDANGDLLLGFC
jgi:hypothetical protein